MGRFDGKVALITGGARGQGRAHARAFANEGADIAIIDAPPPMEGLSYDQGYRSASADQLVEVCKEVQALGRRVVAHEGDVRDQGSLDALVVETLAELGQIDILVANAGVSTIGLSWELSDEEWGTVLDVNLGGVWRAAKAVVPHMIERSQGAIVLTSSVAGLEGNPMLSHYTASKHGILGFMKTLALEVGSHNIRVNAVCPAVVDTELINWQGMWDLATGGSGGTREAMVATFRHWHMLGDRSVLQSPDISKAVLYLASDDANRITGVALPVDAGHLVMTGFLP